MSLRHIMYRVAGVAVILLVAWAYVVTDAAHVLISSMHIQYIEAVSIHAIVCLVALFLRLTLPSSTMLGFQPVKDDDDNGTPQHGLGGASSSSNTDGLRIPTPLPRNDKTEIVQLSSFAPRPPRSAHMRHASASSQQLLQAMADAAITPPDRSEDPAFSKTVFLGWLPFIASQGTLWWGSFALRSQFLVGFHNPWVPLFLTVSQALFGNNFSLSRLLGMAFVSIGGHLFLFSNGSQLPFTTCLILFADASLRTLAIGLLERKLPQLCPLRFRHATFTLPPWTILTYISLTSFMMAVFNGAFALSHENWAGDSVRLIFVNFQFIAADVLLHLLLPFFILHDHGANASRPKASISLPTTGAESAFMYLTGVWVAHYSLKSILADPGMLLRAADDWLPNAGQVLGAAMTAMGVLWVAAQRPSKPIATLMRTIALVIGITLFALVFGSAYSAATLPDSSPILLPFARAKEPVTPTSPSSPTLPVTPPPLPPLQDSGDLQGSKAPTPPAPLAQPADDSIPPHTHICTPYANLTGTIAKLSAPVSLADIESVRKWCSGPSGTLNATECLDVSVTLGQIHFHGDYYNVTLDRPVLSAMLALGDAIKANPTLFDTVHTRFMVAPSIPVGKPARGSLAFASLDAKDALYLPYFDDLGNNPASVPLIDVPFMAKRNGTFVLDRCDITSSMVASACMWRTVMFPAQCLAASPPQSSHKPPTRPKHLSKGWPSLSLLGGLQDALKCGSLVAVDKSLKLPSGYWTPGFQVATHYVRVPALRISNATDAYIHSASGRTYAPEIVDAILDAVPVDPTHVGSSAPSGEGVVDSAAHDAAALVVAAMPWSRVAIVAARGNALIDSVFSPRALHCYMEALLWTYFKGSGKDVVEEVAGWDQSLNSQGWEADPPGVLREPSVTLDHIVLEAWNEWWDWRKVNG
ncbi:hypothetical protein BCR44DRAFT_35292, partial [Catenaria anguillulae PL171]